MSQSKKAIFSGFVARVATLADGGIRVTLDLPEDAIYTAAWLMECKRTGTYLDLVASKVEFILGEQGG